MESWHKAHAQLLALTTCSGMAKSSPVPLDLLTEQYKQHTAHMQIDFLHWITPGGKKRLFSLGPGALEEAKPDHQTRSRSQTSRARGAGSLVVRSDSHGVDHTP